MDDHLGIYDKIDGTMHTVIASLLDNDMYKFTMMQAVWRIFPDTHVKYRFINRDTSMKFGAAGFAALKKLIGRVNELKMSINQLHKLKKACPFLDSMFLEALKNFKLNPNAISLYQDADGNVELWVEGKWHEKILLEVILMAITSFVYFHYEDTDWTMDGQDELALEKISKLNANDCTTADMATRRRRSYEVQHQFVKLAKDYPCFVGTSNVHIALELGIKPIGTMAHEWIMGVSALRSLRYANREALNLWMKVYNGKLGIALTDTFGTEAFFEDFTGTLAHAYDGVRHDSGNPLEFASKVIAHYESLGIDPKTKTIVFSDGLNVDKAIKIKEFCGDRIKVSFGIGTHFSNDFKKASNPKSKSKAMNMVIKLYEVEGIKVVKISDEPGKATGEEQMVAIANHIFFGVSLNLAVPSVASAT